MPGASQLKATIYQHARYRGRRQELKPGRYNLKDLTIGNDQLSSVKVPKGLRVTLYRRSSFRGQKRVLTEDIWFTEDFNDETSSIVVELIENNQTAKSHNKAPKAPPPDVEIPSPSKRQAIQADAEVYQQVGRSLGKGYLDSPPEELPGRPLPELIKSGALPQYDLMQTLEASIKEDVLVLDKALMGDYGVLADAVAALLDILTPIRNVEMKFNQVSPGMVGQPGMEIEPDDPNQQKLATPENHALQIEGDVDLLNLAARLEYADFFHYKGAPHCSFRYKFNQAVGLGTLFTGVPLIQGLKLSDGACLIAATASTLYDPELDSGINEGLNFFGNLEIAESNDKPIQFIGLFFGIEQLAVHGAIDTASTPPEYLVEAAVKRNITFVDGEKFKLSFVRSDVGIAVKGKPPEPSVEIAHDLVVALTSGDQTDYLVLTGGMKVEPESVTGSFTMNGTGRSYEGILSGEIHNSGEWHHPFGIPGIIIRQFAVQIGFSYLPPWVDNIGMHANMKLGDVDGSISILVDTNDFDQFVLAGTTDRITLLEIMSAMTPQTFMAYHALPAGVRKAMNRVVDVALEDVKISIVPSATSIGGVHFQDEGVTIAGSLSVFGWRASLYLNVDTFDGITARADMEPIHVSNVFKVSGAGSDLAPQMRLGIFPVEPPYLYVSAKVELLSLSRELQIKIDQDGAHFIFNQKIPRVLETHLSAVYKEESLEADGTINFHLNVNLDTVLGKIKLPNVEFNADAVLRIGQQIGFYASFSGDFRFQQKQVTFPTLTLHTPPEDFEAVYDAVIQQIEDSASDMFKEAFRTLEDWVDAVSDGAITLNREIAEVAKDVYHETKELAAVAYKNLKKSAKEAARGLKTVYNASANETAKILKEVDYAADQVADTMEDVFYLSVDGAAKALKYAGYGAEETAKALKRAYRTSAVAVAEALERAYDHSAEAVAEALKQAGYGVKEAGEAIESVYDLAKEDVNSVLKQAGYAADQVDDFFSDVGDEIEKVVDKIWKPISGWL